MANELREWMPLYIDLWKGESVRKLSMAARAVYLDMLMFQFLEGSLPNDLGLIARLIGCYKEELESVWPEIQDKFKEAENGRLFNPKMSQVRHEQEEKNELYKTAGSNGAKKRWANHNKAKSDGNSPPNSPPIGNAKRPPNSNKNKNTTTPNGVETDVSDTSKPYGEVHAVLSKVADKLEWTQPTPADIRRHLKDDSNVRLLVKESSIDEVVELFVFAWKTWNTPPTWSSVFGQRNQLRDQIRGRTNGHGHAPKPGKVLTEAQLAEAMK